jgi:hypothetical protein
MDKLKQIKNNLSYVQASINNGSDKEQAAILALIITETIEAARSFDLSYKLPYSSEKHKNHMYTFYNYAEQTKAKLISDLQEIQRELSIKKGNTKRVLKLIEKLLLNNLYKNELNSKIRRWRNTTSFPTSYQVIYTKLKGE